MNDNRKSNNFLSADNQQERSDSYISGFVDGEGSFHIAIQRAKHTCLGWQLIPEFHVSQNFDYAKILKFIKERFDCGYIKPNHARNVRDKSYAYVVRNRNHLLKKIIP
ncbi:MAG TPA: LAGLIDADG family homing endonuclease, partial [Mycoplasmatales bacterium]|nr:LAGLIDADG family homing endonuclease [Mycoplasmatales bacterium]